VLKHPLSSHVSNSTSVELVQTADSWGLQYSSSSAVSSPAAAQVSPLVLLVDGTNLGCISAGSSSNRHRQSKLHQSTAERFSAWLQFLAAFTDSCIRPNSHAPRDSNRTTTDSSSSGGDTLACVLVAFDNKGSALTNVRAQLQPAYLSKRYPSQQQQQQSGKPPQLNVALSGWAELSGVVDQLNHCKQQQQQQLGGQGSAGAAPPACPYLVTHAAYGFEADDAIAAAAQWVSGVLYFLCSAASTWCGH
jgi:hypothetical protein